MLTDKYIQSLKATGKEYFKQDYDGLSIKVSPIGSKHWSSEMVKRTEVCI